MRPVITIAGASGVVGHHIIKYARENHFEVRILTRKIPMPEIPGFFYWDPENGDAASLRNTVLALEGANLLINLAGVSLSEGRLTQNYQNKILESRLRATRFLTSAYSLCQKPPLAWAQASATGFYGDTGEEIVTEKTQAGNLFLSSVCMQWEKLLLDFSLQNPNLQYIITRFGIVFASDAKAWEKMIRPIRFGLGGPLGTGKQWYPWIDADEIPRALFYLVEKKQSGVFNFTSPTPVRQHELAFKIAKILKRPAFFRLPAFMVRLIMGKGGDELILASCRALPEKLIASGYKFEINNPDQEIEKLLGSAAGL